MGVKLQFLLIDDNREGDSRISGTLLQRFPEAKLTEFPTFAAARDALSGLPLEAPDCIAIAGRVRDLATVPLIKAVRACNSCVPVIAMGSLIDEPEAIGAGANRFLDYEAWLLLPPTIHRLRAAKRATDLPA